MWEKKEVEKERYEPAPARNEAPRTAAAPTLQPKAAHANIGQSLFIKGDVTGSEDLIVEGRIEGRIDLKDHNLTIGQNGRVHAEIHAKSIIIVGEVTGNVVGDEKVELTDTARLVGDIRAPRVSVSDGAQFKGSVDMVRNSQTQTSGKDRAAQSQPLQAAVQMATAGVGK